MTSVRVEVGPRAVSELEMWYPFPIMVFTSLPSRLLTVILRIMVLVAMVPVMGFGHTGHDYSSERTPPVVAAAVIGHATVHMPAAQTHEDEAGSLDTCPGCCSCQAFATPASGSVRDLWRKAACVASRLDQASPSVVPEALPEPPRSFA